LEHCEKIKKCESVLVVVGRGLVGDTSVGGVGSGIYAIEVVLAFGLIGRTEGRNVLSRSVKIVQSSTVNLGSAARCEGRGSRGDSTHICHGISLHGTNQTERAIRKSAVMGAFAASGTRRIGTDDSARATRANSGGETKNRSWGGVGWGLLETTVLGIEGNHCCSADGSSVKRRGSVSERFVEAHISIVVHVSHRAVKTSIHEDSAQLLRRQSHTHHPGEGDWIQLHPSA
jgi:hypothetical protein